MSMSSSESSSSDLDTNLTQHIQKITPTKQNKKQTKPKPKSKSEPTAVAVADAKNEGDDPDWAYAPPKGAVLLDHTVDVGPLEWDALKDDEDTEMWLIRVPDTLKAKHLQGLEIDLASSSSRTTRIGCLTRKTATYDVWSLGHDADHDGEDDAIPGAEELRSLACLLPRKRKHGQLYLAPKQVSRHIVVSARPSLATPAPEGEGVIPQNPPRRAYPKDVLTHAFVPYGARSEKSRSEDVSMEVEEITPAQDPAPAPTEKSPKEPKAKKRKGDGDTSPKKSKKHKSTA